MLNHLLEVAENDRRLVVAALERIAEAAENAIKISKSSRTQSVNLAVLEIHCEQYREILKGREWVLKQ